MNGQLVNVAVAILYRENKFLMQLRDNIPNIIAPGCWALFGGHIEPGETPEIAVQREVLEEIGYKLTAFSQFGIYSDQKAVRYVFQAPLLVPLDQLVLSEGWDLDLLTAEDIQQGEYFSQKAGEVRPLATLPQKIMLDFIKTL
ncbi:NUDIX hydrolase [Dolichospermum circinale]|uniref:NUDIX hydrolase n=1 Tax=Dolichospermum circinale TaxID=109265 RepID=UPI000402944E|nr:NUDIX hydrolase [Dolichospermum circinale]MDB9454671.1 NUDIX hydrolase [Dolichospermum circinale CS-541/06]MDB9463487.1 NUDIX hydrolase [Dolichospermum circinale CS-541/04]MDB9475574.1 NUDIX hydrolase [Dolichospermum circinale CS-537/11]MDB9477639.1 NUDIX hydrolase [Dolichospermum circinale CS-537/03]MDB9547632.1 NUDIX hydrolase [Dolichospermum circinale CS-1031]